AALEAALAKRPVGEWLARLETAGIPTAPIHDLAQVLDDPQLAARGMGHTLGDRDGRAVLTPGPPVVLGGAQLPLGKMWPRLGEHQEVVLRAWLGEGTAK